MNYQEWCNHEKIEFRNEIFSDINIPICGKNEDYFNFKTELVFENCSIQSFDANCLILEKSITFKNCKIGSFGCHATYFCGGFQMYDCVVNKSSTFDCGVHNIAPNEFIIENCLFYGYVDFFDVYFGGTVSITNNNFQQGTNIGVYLGVPYGIEEGILFKLENNKGQLDKCTDDDSLNPPIKNK